MGRITLNRFQQTLKDLSIGEIGWTVAWAIEVDAEGNCYLDLDFTYTDEPGGEGKTNNVLIKREHDRYIADISNDDYKWRPSKISPSYVPVEIINGNAHVEISAALYLIK